MEANKQHFPVVLFMILYSFMERQLLGQAVNKSF